MKTLRPGKVSGYLATATGPEAHLALSYLVWPEDVPDPRGRPTCSSTRGHADRPDVHGCEEYGRRSRHAGCRVWHERTS